VCKFIYIPDSTNRMSKSFSILKCNHEQDKSSDINFKLNNLIIFCVNIYLYKNINNLIYNENLKLTNNLLRKKYRLNQVSNPDLLYSVRASSPFDYTEINHAQIFKHLRFASFEK